ncbi:MAG: primosomal protein N' [Chlamydiia bacterium]|nr:primosomal protein N' [Chlamydiia bacterium]
MTFPAFASVALETGIDKELDYGIPAALLKEARRGVKVTVPLQGRFESGYILAVKETPSFPKCRPIQKVHSKVSLTDDLFELALWMARYYGSPLRPIFKALLPSSVRRETKEKTQRFVMRTKTREELRELTAALRGKFPAQAEVLDVMLTVEKGILLSELLERANVSESPVKTLEKQGALKLDIVRIDRSPLLDEDYFRTKPKTLTPEQKSALDKITTSNGFSVHLLHGVTGSGKTEVYLQAIDACLKEGKGAIVLVPEISLTTQMIERFRSRFDSKIAVLHSRLSHGERLDEWERIRSGAASVVIGPRSAVFSPVPNLGILICDEEHESSYKQAEEAPFYNARDIAVMRGKIASCPVILGSATPSLESYTNALSGKYILSTLQARADSASLPETVIVDMRREYKKQKGFTIFSDALLSGIEKRSKNGEQTILFLNRRGYNTSVVCSACQEAVKCSRCDVSLTYHKRSDHLQCHLCGEVKNAITSCPSCGGGTVRYKGVGTEQVERALHAILPEVRTIRVDADTTKHKGSHEKLLRAFGVGKADVLIGTQMIAKGLHFPEVTLVGVLNCDGALNIPDFRSAETVFQLITQVSGRAGRGVFAGEVLIQTALPDNSTILHASNHDYLSFYNEEIALRKLFGYPPFIHLVKVSFSGVDEAEVSRTAERFNEALRKVLSYEILPVTPAGHAKVQDRYRMQFIIKAPNVYDAVRAYHHVLAGFQIKAVRIQIDVDPTSTYF